MSATIKTKEEIETLRTGGKKLGEILKVVAREVRVGMATLELDGLAESLILKAGGLPAFKGYETKGSKNPFPNTLCISVNQEVVHGIPTSRKLVNGDVLKIDIGMRWPSRHGLFTDTAMTLGVGQITKEAEGLIAKTREATYLGIKAVRAGVRVGDISFTIQKYLDKHKIGIVRDLAGHGVGYAIHEDPLIPNYGTPGTGIELAENMVLAVEVMTTLGDGRVKLAPDGWAFCSRDDSLGGHFEHTIAVTADGSEILT